MRRSILASGPKQNGSVAVSLVANAILIALLASITFTYPPSAFFGAEKTPSQTERVTYVQVQPRGAATVGNGAAPNANPKKVTTPVRAVEFLAGDFAQLPAPRLAKAPVRMKKSFMSAARAAARMASRCSVIVGSGGAIFRPNRRRESGNATESERP